MSPYGDDVTETPACRGGSWRDLLGPKYLGTSTVLAGGVALYATNEFLTISLLPSAVADIGGQRLYAWVTTVYLVASVVAATTVSALLARFGPRSAYLLGLAVFGLGSLMCAVAPTMEVLLAGRVVQGGAGGLLAGLGYAVINSALPQWLWTKASALVSAMWGVGTLVGPGGRRVVRPIRLVALGFRCAGDTHRGDRGPGAYRAAGSRRRDGRCALDTIPVWSLLLLGGAAMTVSVAGIPRNVGATAALLAGGVLAGRGVPAWWTGGLRPSVLPPSAFRPGPLKWIYVTLGLLMAATMADMYVPLFGQRLAHLVPVAAGFLGVALSIGWTSSEILSASVSRTRTVVRIVAVAPLVMAVGLALAAVSQFDDASPRLVSRCGCWRCSSPAAVSAWPGHTCRPGRWAASTIPPRAAPPQRRSTPCS